MMRGRWQWRRPVIRMAVVVQSGGTLAKACFPGWCQCRRPRIIGSLFLLRSVRARTGDALVFQDSFKDAFPAVPLDFHVVLDALAPPSRTGKAREARR